MPVTRTTITPTTEGMSNRTYFSREYVCDQRIVNIANWQLAGLNITATGLANVGGGAPPYTQINSSLCTALHMDTTDTFGLLWRVPEDLDVNKPFDIRIKWSAASALVPAETAVWAWKYKKLIDGITAVGVADVAFDINSGTQPSFGANIAGYTGWNTVNSVNLLGLIPGTDALTLKATLTLVTMATADCWWVEARYYSKLLNAGQF